MYCQMSLGMCSRGAGVAELIFVGFTWNSVDEQLLVDIVYINKIVRVFPFRVIFGQ